ncbi:hypothetical protein B0G76_7484 [Paraburkholderia sp. BL23I1N1]|uniref:competence protein CoiA family protein n=1 Tax=Paraburkholderia sp. BL23I1N1 TaxID=1938802 RepID=UPI000FF0E694|nr:hypothetical protein [Paraburkholderia sp. BL23I1N1]RKE25910.1 hypothetical protein B0G76_7484 [Paraburkholderia sp. BL23I1N1]
MREALNRITGKYVSAEDAHDGPRLYECPECRAPVSLRAGDWKQAYFAHMPGSSGKACGLYVEGIGFGNGALTVHSNHFDGPLEMTLGLRLSDSRALRSWGLELTIPTAGQSGAEVSVDVGGRTQTIRCAGVDELTKNVTAEPQAANYVIVSVLPTNTALDFSLQRGCLGLSAHHATVFGEIGRPGSHVVKRVSELKIGRTYAFVWAANVAANIPEQLECEPLKRRSDWEAALITLSYPLHPQVQGWLQNFTGLRLETALPEIVPVWPPLVRKITAGFLEAIPKAEVTLYSGRLTPSGTLGTNGMFAQSPSQTVGQNAKSASESFYRLIPESERVVELTSQEPIRTQITIDLVLKADFSPTVGVELVGTDANGVTTTVELHSEVSVQWVDDIRREKAQFSYLALPPHVSGQIYAGRDGIWQKQLALRGTSAKARHNDGARLLAPTVAEQLFKLLLNPTFDLLFDFGSFGRLHASRRLSSITHQPILLSPELRARLLAYLFQTRRRLLPAVNARNIADVVLVATFLKSTPDVACTAAWRTLKAALAPFSDTRGEGNQMRGTR